jgi:hypothetical protein
MLCIPFKVLINFWKDVVWLWGRQLSTDCETEPVIGAAREIALTRT